MSEPLAKDLVRNRELQPRSVVGARLVNRLTYRTWRRPAGNSARLWRKVGAEDPFAAPPEDVKPEHRAVYASGRFIRLDQAEKEAKTSGEKLRDAPRAPKKPKPDPDGAPKEVHTPAFGKKAPSPFDRKRATKEPPPPPAPPDPNMDRTPPIVTGPGEVATARSGRIRTNARMQQPTRKPVMAAEPPGGAAPIVPLDSGETSGLFARHRPGMEPRTVSAPKPSPPTSPARPPGKPPAPPTPPAAAQPPRPAAKPTPATPAPSRPAPPVSSGPPAAPPDGVAPPAPLAAPALQLPPGAINTPGPPQSVPVRRPTRAAEPEPAPAPGKPAATPNRAPPMPAGGGGLDDLFGGGAQEGRVRIGRSKPKPPSD